MAGQLKPTLQIILYKHANHHKLNDKSNNINMYTWGSVSIINRSARPDHYHSHSLFPYMYINVPNKCL